MRIGFVGNNNLLKEYIEAIEKHSTMIPAACFGNLISNKPTNNTKIPDFYSDTDLFLEQVDAVIILCNDIDCRSIIIPALKESKHIFVANPLFVSLQEIDDYIKLSTEADVKMHIGTSLSFTPVFKIIENEIGTPVLIESRHFVNYNSFKEPVVFNPLFNDVRLLLKMVKSSIKKMNVVGVPYIGAEPDVVKVRIEFDNGGVADITVGRIYNEKLHQMAIYSKELHLNLDFISTGVLKVSVIEQDERLFEANNIEVSGANALVNEIYSFYDSINNKLYSDNSNIEDAYNALKIIYEIKQKVSPDS